MEDIKDRIKRAKIKIQKSNPFFAILSLSLKFEESEDIPEWCIIDVNKEGLCKYHPERLSQLTDEQIQGLIVHEILHISLMHLLRRNSREEERWDIATDIVVNQILVDNGFKMPDSSLVPKQTRDRYGAKNVDDSISIEGLEIKDIRKKTAEDIYEEVQIELPPQPPTSGMSGIPPQQNPNGQNNQEDGDGQGKGDGQGDGDEKEGDGDGQGNNQNQQNNQQNQQKNERNKNLGRVDNHTNSNGSSGRSDKEIEKDWSDKVHEAMVLSKMAGDIPAGLERLIGKLHEEKINWRALLNNYITNQIPYNTTWAKPNKKSMCIGEYIPDTLKEKIEVVIAVDLSGSIDQEDLNDFMSEIIGMARAYKERIEMRLLTHEIEVNDDYIIENGNIEKIKNIKIKGGGGTSFKPLLKYIEKKGINPKCLIWFTDGYGEEVKKPHYDLLWILTGKQSSDHLIKDSGKVIKIPKE